MDLVEKLKGVSTNTVLYSPLFGEVRLKSVMSDRIIVTTKKDEDERSFDKEGRYFFDMEDSECMLFPSKENRDWESFIVPKFQKGDFLATDNDQFYGIFDTYDNGIPQMICIYDIIEGTFELGGILYGCHSANDAEKEDLYNILSDKGYMWNKDTLSLERKKEEYAFKPFDKVVVKNDKDDEWTADIFLYQRDYSNITLYFCTGGISWRNCVPFEGNEHLVGKITE